MSLNLDSLAEMHWASEDPQYRNDEELTEAEIMTVAMSCIERISDDLNERERAIALDNIDDLIDLLYEVLKE